MAHPSQNFYLYFWYEIEIHTFVYIIKRKFRFQSTFIQSSNYVHVMSKKIDNKKESIANLMDYYNNETHILHQNKKLIKINDLKNIRN